MSRLKKIAGSPDPFIGQKTEDMVKLPEENPNEDKSEVFLIAKELIAALPISPSNSVTYALAEAISNGELGSIEGDKIDFEALLKATQEFLKSKGILTAKKKD